MTIALCRTCAAWTKEGEIVFVPVGGGDIIAWSGRAFVTTKRALENYLHPRCLFEAGGVEVALGDDDD